jgi:hypothetical protein
MRCEDVEKMLRINAELSQLPAGIRAHVLECPVCRRAHALYSGIEQELRELPSWKPPSGFAERVGLLGRTSLRSMSEKPRFASWITSRSALAASMPMLLLGLLTAIFSLLVLWNLGTIGSAYRDLVAAFFKAMIFNAIPLAWITAILSLSFSAWFTRRSLR